MVSRTPFIFWPRAILTPTALTSAAFPPSSQAVSKSRLLPDTVHCQCQSLRPHRSAGRLPPATCIMPGVKSHSKVPGPQMISLFVETALLAQSPAFASHVLPGGDRELQAPTPNSPRQNPLAVSHPLLFIMNFLSGAPHSVFSFLTYHV